MPVYQADDKTRAEVHYTASEVEYRADEQPAQCLAGQQIRLHTQGDCDIIGIVERIGLDKLWIVISQGWT